MNSTINQQQKTIYYEGGALGSILLIAFMPIQHYEKMKWGRSLWEMGSRDWKDGIYNNQIFETGGEGDAPADRRAPYNIFHNDIIKRIFY